MSASVLHIAVYTLLKKLTECLAAIEHILASMTQLLTVTRLGWVRSFDKIHGHFDTLLVPEVVMIENGHYWKEVLDMPFASLLAVMGFRKVSILLRALA